MINSPSKTNLSRQAILPDISEGVNSFLQTVQIGIISKSLVRGKTQEIASWKTVLGARQPMPENLAIKKTGERSWRWHVFHFNNDVILDTDDIIIFDGKRYRIMEKEDWGQYGFLKYNAIEDYTSSQTL